MGDSNPYNGYSGEERDYKFKILKELIAKGDVPPAAGPCALCGDPDPKASFEYHDEDYGEPFIWGPPAMFALCRNCHRDKLHRRFWRHSAWHAFLAHVRRGGYASDIVKDQKIKNEVDAYRAAIERGELPVLRQLRPYTRVIGEEWFANLRIDEASRGDPAARPRQ